MITTNLLSGERVALRAMEPEDLEILYALENDTDTWNVGSTNAPFSRYSLKQFITKGTHDVYTDGQLRLMIESIEDGTAIGMVDLVDFNPRHLRAEIGIILARDYQHKGFGTEVLYLMELYVHQFLHLKQLYAYVSTRNEASLKLFGKASYTATSTLRNWLYINDEFVDVKIFQKIL